MGTAFRELIGLEVSEQGDGTAVVTLHATDHHLNGYGTIHGGVIASIVDVAMGAAVSAAGASSPVTIEMKVTYLEPGKPGPVRAEAKVRKRGKRLTIVEAEVAQEDDLLALALATFTS